MCENKCEKNILYWLLAGMCDNGLVGVVVEHLYAIVILVYLQVCHVICVSYIFSKGDQSKLCKNITKKCKNNFKVFHQNPLHSDIISTILGFVNVLNYILVDALIVNINYIYKIIIFKTNKQLKTKTEKHVNNQGFSLAIYSNNKITNKIKNTHQLDTSIVRLFMSLCRLPVKINNTMNKNPNISLYSQIYFLFAQPLSKNIVFIIIKVQTNHVFTIDSNTHKKRMHEANKTNVKVNQQRLFQSRMSRLSVQCLLCYVHFNVEFILLLNCLSNCVISCKYLVVYSTFFRHAFTNTYIYNKRSGVTR